MISTGLLTGTSPSVQALVLLVVILAEAAALYVGYGILEDTIASFVFEQLRA
ncbi:MAG: hypothetical protein V5A55_10685 [Halovenus sp.]